MKNLGKSSIIYFGECTENGGCLELCVSLGRRERLVLSMVSPELPRMMLL